jgi:hypothetical protein
MSVGNLWVKRNLGFDPLVKPRPAAAFANETAATRQARPDDIQREIIDFDSGRNTPDTMRASRRAYLQRVQPLEHGV